MLRLMRILIAVLLALGPVAGQARHILLTNDDGLSDNVVALYRALKAAGHDVILSVPCTNQSGMSGAIKFGTPLAPLARDCRAGAAKAGAPAAGGIARADLSGDGYYVDGTPVMALLYALDVAAPARWGRAPDLVLSGPNEGRNAGPIVLASGTVSNAQVAAIRGIPAIALSAGVATAGGSGTDDSTSARVARLSVELVTALEAAAGPGPLLPPMLALNVNFPDRLDPVRWRLTRIGSFAAIQPKFVVDIAESRSPLMTAIAANGPLPHLPGITFEPNAAAPRQDQADDEAVVSETDISVSPMQAGYDAPGTTTLWLRRHLIALPGIGSGRR